MKKVTYTISDQTIRHLVPRLHDPMTRFTRAENYYLQQIIVDSPDHQTVHVFGSFKTFYSDVYASLTLTKTQIRYSCSCSECSQQSGCTHVATLLSWVKSEMKELEVPYVMLPKRISDDWPAFTELFVPTDSLIDHKEELIRKNEEKNLQAQLQYVANIIQIRKETQLQQLYPSKTVGSVRIEITLMLYRRSSLSASSHIYYLADFKVGRSKMYVIRSLPAFLYRIDDGEFYSYGKQLEFDHRLENFTPDAQKIIIMLQCSLSTMGRTTSNDRSWIIDDENLDDFFATVSSLEDPSACSVIVERKDLALSFTFEEKTLGQITYYQLSRKKAEDIKITEHGFYQITGRRLVGLSAEHPEVLMELWNITQTPLIMASDQLSDFIQLYIEPNLKQLKVSGLDVQPYLQSAEQIQFYLDLNEDWEITIMPVLSVNNQRVYLFDGQKRTLSLKAASLEAWLSQEACRIDLTQYHAVIAADASVTFVRAGIDQLKTLGEVFISQRLRRFQEKRKLNLQVGVRVESDLLHVSFKTEGLDGDELRQLLSAYHRKKRYYKLSDGSMIDLENNPEMEQLEQLDRRLHLDDCRYINGEYCLETAQALRLESLPEQFASIQLERQASFEQLIRAFHQEETVGLPEHFTSILRDYQKAGFYWLKKLEQLNMNGILADDMGLGKTVQVIALLESSRQKGRHSLVVCPSSLALNWQAEVAKFAHQLSCQVILGPAAVRAAMIAQIDQYDLSITTYDYLKRDIELLQNQSFYTVILDEAQVIKKQRTKNASSVKQLQAQHRLALTGTPIENSLAELWSIFDFLMPKFLFNYHYFQQTYERPIVIDHNEAVSQELKKLVEPFILRRTKKAVLKELPEKIETLYTIEFSEEEWPVYLANLAQVSTQLKAQLKTEGPDRFMVLAMLTKLRQLCCDPRLVYEEFKEPGNKMKACLELIESLAESGKKILLFSSFTSILDALKTELDARSIASYTLQGSTAKEERQRLVNMFQSDATPVFLISLKAGGTGLNLTAAEAIIHYDPWWNLSAQNQATDRAYRIGQEKAVTVYNLIMKDSIEEKIVKLQQEKKKLSDVFVEDSHGSIAGMSAEEMLDLFALPESATSQPNQ